MLNSLSSLEGLIIGRNFAFKNELALTVKTSLNTVENSLKQLTLNVYGLVFGGF